jgi:hypothetical protein
MTLSSTAIAPIPTTQPAWFFGRRIPTVNVKVNVPVHVHVHVEVNV